MVYLSREDIKKLVDDALDISSISVNDSETTVRYMYGILQGYLYAIQKLCEEE